MGASPFTHTYAYNTIGNLTSMTGVGSYTYDPAHKHQATAAGSNTFAYDVAGNMTSRTIAGQATQNLVWDESSRLETLTQGTATTGFLYDADGNRVARRDNGVTTVMIDNTFEWSSAGGLVSYYSHAGQVIAMRKTTGLQWMFGDHLGSASTVRTPAGVNIRQRYLPFGRLRGAATLPTEYGFTGQRLDPSGLMDYNARQYDPVLGRFTSPDTIIPAAADPQSFNRYTYVTNNPVNLIDPSGHKGCSPGRKCPAGSPAGAPGGGSGSGGGKSGGGESSGPSMPAQVPTCSICGGFSTMPAHEGGPNWGLTYSTPILGQIAAFTRLVTDWGSLSGWQRAEAGAVVTIPFLAKGIQILRGGAGTVATNTVDVAGANFAQTTASRTFSSGGTFAGQSIDEVAGALRSGAMSAKDVPVQVIVQDGNTMILNTRSALALEQAGVPRSAWNVVNVTGDPAAQARLAGQLARNGLDSTGTSSVRITGAG